MTTETTETIPNSSERPDQLSLFAIENPLKSRFQRAFFKEIPQKPGVYWMLDERERVLYVGKAKNLRARLRSYRNTSFERHSSKNRRLLRQVARIEWDVLESEEAALLRENEFLRAIKPPFNIANVKPETYLYLALNISEERFEIARLFHRSDAKPGDILFGAFKGIQQVLLTQAALGRWAWALTREHCDWPHPLVKKVAPLRMSFARVETASPLAPPDAIALFLAGLVPLPELVLPMDEPSPFIQGLWAQDQMRLARFFMSAARLKNLRAGAGRGLADIVDQLEVDDLIVQRRFRTE